MTNNIAKIRAALEMARDYISSDLASERGAFEGYEGVSRIDEIKADLAAALAALAELEKAAAEPVAWMWDDMLGISHTYVSPKRPTWPDAGASPEMAVAINVRPLYAAPPAPVAKIREAVVTDDVLQSAFLRACAISDGQGPRGLDIGGTDNDEASIWLEAWRSELGPTLGLVDLKEPTPEECERICTEYERLLMREGTCGGRDAFDAVRNVMWPKEGL